MAHDEWRRWRWWWWDIFLSSLIFFESTMFPISICDDISHGDEVDRGGAVHKRTPWQCALDWSHQSRLCEQELLSYPDATFHLLLLLKAALFLRSSSSSSSSLGSSSPSTSSSSSKPHFSWGHNSLPLCVSVDGKVKSTLPTRKIAFSCVIQTPSVPLCLCVCLGGGRNCYYLLNGNNFKLNVFPCSVLVLPIFYGNKAVTDQFTRWLIFIRNSRKLEIGLKNGKIPENHLFPTASQASGNYAAIPRWYK